jgi:hypothetical protein
MFKFLQCSEFFKRKGQKTKNQRKPSESRTMEEKQDRTQAEKPKPKKNPPTVALMSRTPIATPAGGTHSNTPLGGK